MAGITVLHSSDLHLGRRFGTMPESLRGRLVEARHEALGRLAEAARAAGAAHVLLAGDTFDSETPPDAVRRQALAEMDAAADLTWWVLPGNHDSLAAEPLWEPMAAEAPDCVRLLTGEAPAEMAPGVWLLPAPLPRRFPGRDLTAWMPAAATPEGAVRLGLAHGSVTEFGPDDASDETIPPDRAETAGLDYLALGDWHGTLRIGPRLWYSGTPERDRYRHAGRGQALVVHLPGPGAAPQVTAVETGRFHWAESLLALAPGAGVAAALDGVLPGGGAGRRDHLVRVRASGWLRLPERGALEAAAAAVAPEFAAFALETGELGTEVQSGDLDGIATGGALRAAAEVLRTEADDPALPEAERTVAAAALDRLWSLAQEAV